jgi:DNA replication protein DnaD
MPDDLILLAYDKTVTNTGSLKWRYMDKIIKSFYELGYRTAEDVKRNEKREKTQTSETTLDTDAAARLRELNRQKKVREK